ncbi:MAG: holo-ACP synthase [Clostridia bacterium]|nr:holo-ACP synthase [Clostridia bacterium]
MKVKTGIDTVEIERISKSLEISGFADRILSDAEYEYYSGKGMKAESIAGAWCAKEAFSKVLGRGFSGFAMDEVQILHDDLGKPYYSLLGAAAELAKEQGITSLDLSITHDKTRATAVAVALTED